MYLLILLGLCVSIIIVLLLHNGTFDNLFTPNKDTIENHINQYESYNRLRTNRVPLYKSKPSKCFDCEKEVEQRYGEEYVTFTQPSKCFDCEKEFVHRDGLMYGQFANPTKSFDSESHLWRQYM